MFLPQLESKSAVQFGYQRATANYRFLNQLSDGSIVPGDATRPLKRVWDLSYRGLTAVELATLDEFCNGHEAGGDGFVFVDPTQNMLASSEELTDSVWQKGAMIVVTGAGFTASSEPQEYLVTNGANTEQSVWQDLEITGAGRMCASCMVRSDEPAVGKLILTDDTTTNAAPIESDTKWQLLSVSADVNVQTAPLTLSVTLSPGSAMEVKALQLEYQPFPSRYKPTTGKGGIHPGAYVLTSSLQVTQHGPDWFDCSFRIVA